MSVSVFVESCRLWLLRFLFIQFFLMLISLPFIAAWGLPFSLLSMAGNLLYSPFLICHLFLSFAIFFTELFCIPNNFFLNLLELLTELWTNLISIASSKWLVHIPFLSSHFFLIILVIALGIVALQGALEKKVLLLALLAFISYSSLKILSVSRTSVSCLLCGSRQALLLIIKNKKILIDSTALSGLRNIEEWHSFTLKPVLSRLTGDNTLDLILLISPSRATEHKTQYFANNNYAKQIAIIEKTERNTRRKQIKADKINSINDKQSLSTFFILKEFYEKPYRSSCNCRRTFPAY